MLQLPIWRKWAIFFALTPMTTGAAGVPLLTQNPLQVTETVALQEVALSDDGEPPSIVQPTPLPPSPTPEPTPVPAPEPTPVPTPEPTMVPTPMSVPTPIATKKPVPVETPEPTVAPRKAVQSTSGVEQWRDLVSQYDWPVDEALAVMKAESGGNPNAHSPTADRGLMQINQVHRAKVGGDLDLLFDPETNVRIAYGIWAAQGWCPWYAARKIGVATGCN